MSVSIWVSIASLEAKCQYTAGPETPSRAPRSSVEVPA